MKALRFVILFSITIAIGVSLNQSIYGVPPLGKFLSPFQGFWQNAETAEKQLPEILKLDGLSAETEVFYDELDIPHIFAQNDEDLHFVQGYITARDRLWQMDFFSRLILGRLSEVLGERALDTDRLNRRIGLKKMTENLELLLHDNEEVWSNVQAYSNGVNAYLKELDPSNYPIEFKLLNYEPEAWTPTKTCLGYAMLANTLSKSESDLENTNLINLLGPEVFDLLYPEQVGNLDPVIPNEVKWDFEPIPVKKPELNYPDIQIKQTLEKPHPLNGSNNFAVAAAKTKRGFAMLANEPDLELTLPSIWYATHLHSPTKNVFGVTIPGTPLILIGLNDSIAWGVTNSPRDQVDWYSVEFKDESRQEYRYNNKWFKTEQIIETIEVKGTSPFYDTIIYVHHGPVVYDRSFMSTSEKVNLSMRWIGHDPNTTFITMNELNKAQNHQQFLESLKSFTGPPQNFIFASVKGDIALALPGKFPVKWEGQGKFLMDGSNPEYEWKDYIPFDQMLQVKNPEKGFLSSANQHQVDTLYPYWVYDHKYEYNRNRRINDRLRILDQMDEKDMMRLQNDNFNYQASESLPMFLDSLDSSRLNPAAFQYLNELVQWDYFNLPDKKAASIFQLWIDGVYENLWDEFDTMNMAIVKPNKYVTIHLLKNDLAGAFKDILSTPEPETTQDLITRSYLQAVDSLNQWKELNGEDYGWSTFKNTKVNHLLRLKPFSVDHVRIGGYGGIVNAASTNNGPSWRMVVELDPAGVKVWGVYPGSQTGNPGNPAYGEMISDWSSGKYTPMVFGHEEIQKSKRIQYQQQFQPTLK